MSWNDNQRDGGKDGGKGGKGWHDNNYQREGGKDGGKGGKGWHDNNYQRDGGKDGGKGGKDGGKGKWNNRREEKMVDNDERLQQHQHSFEGGTSSGTGPLAAAQIDALVFLQIMKHCRQHAPYAVTGMLLGLDVEDTLHVTHSFGYVQGSGGNDDAGGPEDGKKYQMEMLKRLREVNCDSNTVGWYQTTHLGSFFVPEVIETQFEFQTEIPRSVLLVYDSLQSAIGKPAFKALQLTPTFMTAYAEASKVGRSAMAEFPSKDMFREIPVVISAPALSEAFLVDWAIADPFSTTSQIGILDMENNAFLDKNVKLLIDSLGGLAEEQNRLVMYERQAARGGKGDDKGKGKGFRQNMSPPKQLDTMVLSQQIQEYCKSINTFAGDAVSKLYLISNKPTGNLTKT